MPGIRLESGWFRRFAGRALFVGKEKEKGLVPAAEPGKAVKITYAFLIYALICCCVAGCTEKKSEPVKIGLSINLSGRGGTAGGYIRDGAMLAVDAINMEGGVNGHKIELLVKDDQNTRKGILDADSTLIDSGVPVIIGHSYSENTMLAYPFVTSHDTLLLTPYTATTKLSGIDDFFVRTAVDNKRYGKALAKLLKKRNAERVSFLMDLSNRSFVEDYLEQTVRYYHGKYRAVRFDSRKNMAWNELVEGLLADDPDTIVLLTEVTMTGIAAQKLRQAGYGGHLAGTIWAQTPDLVRYGADSVEGMSIITFIAPNIKSHEYEWFASRIREKFNSGPTARSVRAYEA
ncbi:MAG TPA: amino acid ABC transporter substrate-binding protein, partial [Thermodesulfobacteriaceae bacterium]|nr:amino acid ABC transporter substrate-binding protein [Thermodesulfobacteriaceae bacterium]